MTQNRPFRTLPVDRVMVGGFWGPWQDVVSRQTARILLDRCIEAGMLAQIDPDKPSPGLVIPLQDWGGTPQMFWDSDLAKSIETIAYALHRQPDSVLEARADAIIDCYARLQDADGYLNSFFQRIRPEWKWTNLRDFHELYCAGHMIEAAVAYFQATGKRRFLDVMCRMADHLVARFGPAAGQSRGYCGHEAIELALVRLARVMGRRAYLDLAKFFIDQRGQAPAYFDEEARAHGRDPAGWQKNMLEYSQSHMPVREQSRVVGHAVRAMYLYSAMADIAAEYGDDSLTAALGRLWADLTGQQMYVTGGIGPSKTNEGFTAGYDLPNDTAYAETCASVGLVFWASRMLGRGPDRRYADVMERALYNGVLAGLSMDGCRFFYENPLESRGDHLRWTWHRCPCCPPNVARLVASVGAYLYGIADDEVAVHLYCASRAGIALANGATVTLVQETAYPWSGTVTLTVEADSPATFALSLRIPSWAGPARLTLNGARLELPLCDGYVRIHREWQGGDRIGIDFPMEPRLLRAHPLVRQDAGRASVLRGPLVYCAEEVDNGPRLYGIIFDGLRSATETALPELGHAVALDVDALCEDLTGWGDDLYRDAVPVTVPAVARLVPYHLWANRSAGEMAVWLRERRG